MAGVLAVLQTDEIALVASEGKTTVLQLVAATNQRVKVKEISVSFKGTDNTDAPALVQVLRQTDAGTMSALTASKMNESDDETLQTTGLHTATAEPTGTDNVLDEEVHPQGGYTWQAPFGAELIVKGGNRVGIAITPEEDVTCVARIMFEE